MYNPRLLVFASGGEKPDEGGSGFENLVLAQRQGILCAEIVAVVSNHENGGVRSRAEKLGIPFVYFSPPVPKKTEDVADCAADCLSRYKWIARSCRAEFVALSGWLKLVKGLDPKTTFNIHPGPLPEFGGPGMYGHHVHEAVVKAHREKGLEYSAVSMHFVTGQYDQGPVFFHYDVPIFDNDTPATIAQRVNRDEHRFQPLVTNMVVQGLISWDGKSISSLQVPSEYSFLRKNKAR